MKIDLRQLFEVVGEQMPVEYDMDLRDYELLNGKPFVTPVAVRGCLKNTAGIVTFEYSVRFTMKLSCDRCLEEFERVFSESFDHVLVNRLESEAEDFILVEDMLLDLDELVVSDVLLSLPSKVLCSEDCKGLCFRCGRNLNQGSCDCVEPKGDPRFDVLKQLLT